MNLDPDEFELGDEITGFHKPTTRPGMTLSVHLDNKQAHEVLDEAERLNITTIELVRRALSHYVNDSKCQAARSAPGPG